MTNQQPINFNFNIQLPDAETAAAFAAGMGPFLAAYVAEFSGVGSAAQNHKAAQRQKAKAVSDAPVGHSDRELRQAVKDYQEATGEQLLIDDKPVPMTGRLSKAVRDALIEWRASLEQDEDENEMLEASVVEVEETETKEEAPAEPKRTWKRQRANA